MSLIASSKKRLVVGMGETGLSVARYLHAQNLPFAIADTRDNPPNLETVKATWPDAQIYLGADAQQQYKTFDEIILSPGVSRNSSAIVEAIEAGADVYGDIDLFSRHAKAPIAAITGTNGKTTVTTLLGEIAKAAGKKVAVGGNIGTPALDLLGEDVDLYVLELSSFQLETTERLNAEVAVILNVTADHMDRYDNMQSYLLAKQRICFGVKKMVVNKNDPLSHPPLPDTVPVTYFKDGVPDLKEFGVIKESGEEFLSRGFETLLNTKNLKIVGRHNIQNVLAAIALAHCLNLSMESTLSAIKNFCGIEHRCEFVAEVNGVKYINDSKATNPGAAVAAIKGLQNGKNIILIAGGDGKGLEFTTLSPVLKSHVKFLICMGVDGPKVAQHGDAASTQTVQSLQEAVLLGQSKAEAGDIVLLSPACASFDMFKNYQERGTVFKQFVEDLVA